MIDQTGSVAPLETAAGLQVMLRPLRTYRDVNTVTLRHGEHSLGASEDADVFLPVGGVHRQHCRIVVNNDAATLTADSRMTWINYEPVDSRQLQDGDRLALGPIEFAVRIQHDAPAPVEDEEPQSTGEQGFDDLLTLAARPEAQPPEPALPTPPADTPPEPDQARQKLDRQEARLAETEQRIAELEDRRGRLQSIVDALLSEAEQERERKIRQEQDDQRRREDLARRENEANIWQSVMHNQQHQIQRESEGLDRRSTALKKVETRLDRQADELDQEAARLEELRRDQAEREALLQSTVEEVRQTEAKLQQREDDLRRRTDEFDARRQSSADDLPSRDPSADARPLPDAGLDEASRTEPMSPPDIADPPVTAESSQADGSGATDRDGMTGPSAPDGRPTAGVDLERQHMNSFRELANLSARSAVARHASSELRNQLLFEGIVTGLFVTATTVLLGPPLWSDVPWTQHNWGIVAAVCSVVMCWKVLATTAKMQANRSVAKSQLKRARDSYESADTESTTGRGASSAAGAGQSVAGRSSQ